MNTSDPGPPADLPDVTVVVATRDRERLLKRTIDGIVRQDFAGRIEVVIVYDRAEPNLTHERDDAHARIRVTTNERTPGLAGARNTGMLESRGQYIAFCDDDDIWRPDKLRRQVEQVVARKAVAGVTGIAVHYDGRTRVRIPDADELTPDLLTRSRMTGAHPSSYLMRRDVIESVGLVDEDLPGGYGEDYDWLIRLSEVGPVSVLREPLVDVLWHRGSYFTNRWESIIDGLDYIVEKYPAIAQDAPGRARILGQRSFALAALGRKSASVRSAFRAFRLNPREQRVWASALVCTNLVSADWVMHQANKRGRGI